MKIIHVYELSICFFHLLEVQTESNLQYVTTYYYNKTVLQQNNSSLYGNDTSVQTNAITRYLFGIIFKFLS